MLYEERKALLESIGIVIIMKNLETYIKIKKIVFNEIRDKALSLKKTIL